MHSSHLTQRWWLRSPRWVPTSAGGFDPERYDVLSNAEPRAAQFLARRHYQPTLPATTHRFGVLEQSDTGEPRLVGVATLGVPASRGVPTNVFPELEPSLNHGDQLIDWCRSGAGCPVSQQRTV